MMNNQAVLKIVFDDSNAMISYPFNSLTLSCSRD